MAAVMAGSTIAAAARQFGLSKQTVSDWALEQDVRTLRTEKTTDLQSLILEYLQTGFRALIVQAEVLSDPHYCRAQDAHALAIAHGVLADKLTGVAATAQALGLVGAAPAGDGAAESRELDAPAAPDAADG